jgi:hypothetical protein
LHFGARVLTMMEYAEHVDFASSGLVKVDGVLLYPDAAAAGKEIVSWPTGLWVIAKRAERLGDRSLIGWALLLSQARSVYTKMFHSPARLEE